MDRASSRPFPKYRYLDTVIEARISAQQFIDRTKKVETEIKAAPVIKGKFGDFPSWNGGKANAAMRRAALDLAVLLPRLQEPI